MYNMLREECSAKLLRFPMNDRMRGGPGQIVEIDESVLVKRKYNRRTMRPQHEQWIFGMYNRQTSNVDADTLIQLIQRYTRPGSTIYFDGWAAYNGLGALGLNHGVIIHAENFVDPIAGVHTNSVEAYWSRAKRKLKAVYGSLDHMKPSYLVESDMATIARRDVPHASEPLQFTASLDANVCIPVFPGPCIAAILEPAERVCPETEGTALDNIYF
eukprot:gene17022-8527_t